MPDNDACIVARESIAIVATGYSISKYANEKDSLVEGHYIIAIFGSLTHNSYCATTFDAREGKMGLQDCSLN